MSVQYLVFEDLGDATQVKYTNLSAGTLEEANQQPPPDGMGHMISKKRPKLPKLSQKPKAGITPNAVCGFIESLKDLLRNFSGKFLSGRVLEAGAVLADNISS
jgi:hypothetical protein